MTCIAPLTWDNDGAARWSHTERPLTHHLDATERQAVVKATHEVPPECEPWGGKREHYQSQAQDSLRMRGLTIMPWAWITPRCDTVDCLLAEHLVAHHPKRINYPPSLCIYCGQLAYTRDHILPRSWSGDAKRKWVATVPACGECNTAISDAPEFSISLRREIAHERIQRRYRRVLHMREFTNLELRQMGHILRSSIERGIQQRDRTQRRLAWPEDPEYDERAFHQTGILEPADLGLL